MAKPKQPAPSSLVLSCAILMAVAGQATADAGYDRRIAEAAASIVAERMGPLRGSIGMGAHTLLRPEGSRVATAQDSPPAAERGPRPGEWRNGLAPAVEHRRDVSPEL